MLCLLPRFFTLLALLLSIDVGSLSELSSIQTIFSSGSLQGASATRITSKGNNQNSVDSDEEEEEEGVDDLDHEGSDGEMVSDTASSEAVPTRDVVVDEEAEAEEEEEEAEAEVLDPRPISPTEMPEDGPNVTPQADESGSKPISLIVLHRHGARKAGEYDPTTKSITWDHCRMTSNGLRQLDSLGKWLREMYGSIIGDTYQLSSIATDATNYERTIQCATAMLQGLFRNALGPFVRHDDPTMILGLMPWTHPAVLLHNVYQQLKQSALYETFRRKFLQENESFDLKKLDEVLKSDTLCQTPSTLVDCLLLAFDTRQYLDSEGLPCPSVLCQDSWSQILITRLFVTHYTVVEFNEPFKSTMMPATGGHLATMLLRLMREDANRGITLRHLSAHDTTLTVLYHALGRVQYGVYDSREHMPVFGEAIILEVHKGGAFRVVRAVPPQTPSDTYAYVGKYLPIVCQQGTQPSTDLCTFDAWEKNVIENYAPKFPSNICHVLKEDFEREGCDAEMQNRPGVQPSLACRAYRKACPAYGCAANTLQKEYMVNLADPQLPCVKMASPDAVAVSSSPPSGAPNSTNFAQIPPLSPQGITHDPSSKLRVALIIVVVALCAFVVVGVILWLKPRDADLLTLSDHLELTERGEYDANGSRFQR